MRTAGKSISGWEHVWGLLWTRWSKEWKITTGTVSLYGQHQSFVPYKVVVSPIRLRWLYHLSVYGGCIVHLLNVVKVVVSPIRHLITHQFYLRMLNTMFISKLHLTPNILYFLKFLYRAFCLKKVKCSLNTLSSLYHIL